MIKFVVLLTSAITFNFTIAFGDVLNFNQNTRAQEVQLFFTESPIGVESGQPVYPIKTQVFVKSNQEKEFTISVNGSAAIVESGSEVDISKFINPHADTYTVVVEAKSQDDSTHKVFGFTTK